MENEKDLKVVINCDKGHLKNAIAGLLSVMATKTEDELDVYYEGNHFNILIYE